MNITRIPILELSTSEGVIFERSGALSRKDIKQLLKTESVRFVVADIGSPLRWISDSETFQFWKSEGIVHVSDNETARLDEYPEGYVYFASAWHSSTARVTMVLMEKHH